MTKKFTYVLLAFLLTLNINAQHPFSYVEDGMAGLLPQQKVYLQLDKDEYYAGDRIWFKAYVLDADSHMPDTIGTTLFIDIFNTNKGLLEKKTLKVDYGYSHGDFYLNDSLPEGNYSIRAYTSWMLNFDREFVFEQRFFVSNPIEEKIISRAEARVNRKYNRELKKRQDQFKTEFYPEGGQIIEGIPNRIAFFSSNLIQEGVKVSGFVSDNQGNRLAEFNSIHRGKGVFEFTPEKKKKYSVNITYPNGKSASYPIRNIVNEGFNLRVEPESEGVILTVNRSWNGNDIPEYVKNPYLVLHKRGEIIKLMKLSSLNYPSLITIEKDELPAGVIVATLFNAEAQVMAERLFFIQPESKNNIEMKLNNLSEGLHNLELHFPDGVVDSAAHSIAITAYNNEPRAPISNIISNVYLTSDILHPVQKPNEYLYEDDRIQKTDLLMMVSSWKRFTWDDVTSGEEQETEFARDSGFPIYGVVKPTLHSRKVDLTDFEISLKFEEDGKIFITRTDEEGKFSFDGFENTGNYEAEITLLGIRGSTPESIELFPDRLNNEGRGFNSHSRKLTERGTFGWRWRNQARLGTSDSFIQLHDETKKPGYGRPDQVIYLKENDLTYQTMRDVLVKNVSGVIVDGFSILIRGKSSINLTNQPLIMVDGIQYSSRQFLLTPPAEMSYIEIYKGTSAAIFGLRGANGAIVAYSRRGTNPEKIVFRYVLEGYYEPQAFTSEDGQLKELFFEDQQYNQTIFWQPYIKVDEQGKANISIPAKKLPPYMAITIEGIDRFGNVSHARRVFQPADLVP